MSKKILVITFYWPPAGGIAVLRWLQFCKYLPNHGWDPIVYTAKDAHYPMLEEGLLEEVDHNKVTVLRNEIWEPYDLYKSFTGMKKEKKVQDMLVSENKEKGWKEKFGLWVRANFFIPDARKFWINSSVKYLENYIKDHPVDLIVSNGPPHSMHLIGRALKKKTGIPWVADFRDPWTKIDYYHHLPLMNWADRKHKRFEKAVLSEADLVTSHSWETSKDFKIIGKSKVKVITNGFDDVDFPEDINFNNPYFEITHVGSINSDRNTPLLWKVLEELAAEDDQFNEDLKIKLVGKIDISTKRTIANYEYKHKVEFLDFVPHLEACQIMQNSTILLLLLKKIPTIKAVIPGKIFEYLAAKRPILCLGADDGDSARIIKEVNAGVAINHGDKPTLRREIKNLYHSFKDGSLKGGENFQQYSRKNLAKKYAALIDEVVANHQKN